MHYYFFAEAPSNATEPQWHGNIFGQPPGKFEFLTDVFRESAQKMNGHDGDSARPHGYRVSFINDFDVKTTVYHQMNADILVATGSSFPLVAPTVSPKVRQLTDG